MTTAPSRNAPPHTASATCSPGTNPIAPLTSAPATATPRAAAAKPAAAGGAGPALHGDEPGASRGGGGQPGRHRPGRPAVRAGLDQARGQRGQRHDRGQLAGGVGAPVPGPARRGDPAEGEPGGGQPGRDVDREHQPPAHGRGQPAAQDRARGGGQPADPAPQADRAGPPGPVRVAGLQQRQRAGHQERRRRSLDEPDEDQDADRGGQRVAVDHPLQAGDPAAQVLAERGQRQVHRGRVEDDHEVAERHGQQRHPG